MERGHLFHASGLTEEQLQVPIYYKLGSDVIYPKRDLFTSHIDIFPTILHVLYGNCDLERYFDGESILKPGYHEEVTSWRFYFGLPPSTFVIHSPGHTVHGRLSHVQTPLASTEVMVTSPCRPAEGSLSAVSPGRALRFLLNMKQRMAKPTQEKLASLQEDP